jgi:hypothetical protein
MGTFRGGIVALAMLTGAVALTVPAVAEDGRGPVYFDQPYLPFIWQKLYGGVNLGWAGPATLAAWLATARVEIRRDTFDWYRGYGRRRL